MTNRVDQDEILERFKKSHGDKYDYSKVVFVKVNERVIITCSIHGDFLMRPKAHYDDLRGCEKCDTSGKSGFSWNNNWTKKPKFIYVIEVVNAVEKFIKIGVTVEKKVKNRFIKGQIPYNYEIIFEARLEDGQKAFDIEKQLKKKYPVISFVPSRSFSGDNECLEYGIKHHLLKEIKMLVEKASK